MNKKHIFQILICIAVTSTILGCRKDKPIKEPAPPREPSISNHQFKTGESIKVVRIPAPAESIFNFMEDEDTVCVIYNDTPTAPNQMACVKPAPIMLPPEQ